MSKGIIVSIQQYPWTSNIKEGTLWGTFASPDSADTNGRLSVEMDFGKLETELHNGLSLKGQIQLGSQLEIIQRNMELKKYCVFFSDSPITAIKVETKDDAEQAKLLGKGKHIVISEVTTKY